MKTSPNISTAGIANCILRRVIAEKLLISPQPPLCIACQFIGKHKDAGLAGMGNLRGNLLRNRSIPW